MEWMFLPFKRYADFSGRSRRKEYWMFSLLNSIVLIVLGFMYYSAKDGNTGLSGMRGPVGIAFLLWLLAIFIPGLAVQVRRFHDQDKSGLFVLLGFIPYLGALIVFVFMVLEGTRGPNRFGPDPKADESLSITAASVS